MHKLEKLILEAYGELLYESDSGRLFDYLSTKYHVKDHFHSDNSYMVQRKADSKDQYVIFDFDKDKDQFYIRQLGGYSIDDAEAGEAGMNGKGSSRIAGIESYFTDGNYSPEEISVDALKKIVDHVMTGHDREAEAQRAFYADRGPTSGTVDEGYADYEPGTIAPKDLYYSDKHGKLVAMDDVDDKYHDRLELVYRKGDKIEGPMDEMSMQQIEKESDGKPLQWEDLTDAQRKGIVQRYGEPKYDGKHDFFSSNMDTYFKAYSKNLETGSLGHRVIKLPSFASLYHGYSDIIRDIKKLMGSDDVRKDQAARELFELIKTNFRKVQRYLRTERPEQYNLLKMQRMMEGIQKYINKVEGTLSEADDIKKKDIKNIEKVLKRVTKIHKDQSKTHTQQARDLERYTDRLKVFENKSLIDMLSEEEPTPEEKPDMSAPKETVLEDATDTMLAKFPTLKAAIVKLQTEDFKEFVDSIDWISPRPTEFRINLKNGQDYILKWTGTGFEAQIQGKRYYINKINDYQQALDKLAILYKEGPMSGAGEGEPADTDTGGGGGGGGGDFPGDDAGGGGETTADDLGGDDAGAADDAGGGADLTGEPIDFEEPAEEPEA